ncbi:phosphorylase b kinase gamma catalytic chain, skeletal muscle/heart isoform-like isoform X2 [Mercenaria mercenaria]|uniref:phosphorylase b kinase gamma catalytic chain, skeletal muscle/heart isoform-like isoform X2 n=1 Tax=Mercenaria mercenaria TaxID=6596 RepID=UPI00234F105B|nr:phosphorylase b kinase gamma catalytic chain, skeletal muscle/heart isoform-like isoform X2 [Mercenaria mercenaria]
MVKSLKKDIFDIIDNGSVKGFSCKQMEDPNNNVETCPRIERSDPLIGKSDSKNQPLDNVNLVFTSNDGENFSITLHEVIGRGISSVVRKCTEKNTGKEYAVKIIDISGERSDSYQTEQTKDDTIREINILRMCTGHEQIIELHDAFETPTFIFLVFELCKQGELFDYLTQVVTLSEKRTRIIMKQLLTAVEYLHSKNIVHRDLKPENILLDDNLNVKLSDFGFATVLGPNEELAELCGTPGYLAPEVLAVSMYDNVPGYRHEVDMWACGVIMYTLLCGAPPFWHRKQMQMLRMIMQGNYKFGSPEWDDISLPPKDLISKLLVVDPRKRLTAKEALEHTFFQREITPEKKFEAKKHFKAAVLCINFFYRLKFFFNNPPPVSIDILKSNPYSVKFCRKLLDGCAFKMYGHWVKKADNQNRAALFEHVPRDEWQSEFPR